ncbi:hypothetical protein FQR65_LT04050 [Abscondita terminalis]|nr:hypothetical protein FQR65_LT04050 [Abscondita terminalis]
MSTPIEGLDALYSEFRGSSINNVPIIRIFGSSDSGHKTCLHIHGVFPYLYIPYDGTEDSNSLVYQIANKLDQAINISLGHATSTTQHIYKIVLVPFYGYHYREHQFLKIFFYNPLIMKRASSLLQNGHVFGKIYQLHEAHIPFILQFMIDYNLHGMNFISLSQVFYRVDENLSQTNIPSQFLLPPTITKNSCCHVEGDALAEFIVNRVEVAAGKITKNPGIAALWEDERQRRRNKDETSQISPCMSQSRIDIPPTGTDTFFKNALKDKLIAGANNERVDGDTICHVSTNESSLSSSRNSDCSFLDDSYLDCSNFNDTQANDLLKILQELAADVNKVEEDSILSQTIIPQDESEDDNEGDMTMPFITTPMKHDFEKPEFPIESSVDGFDLNTADTGKHDVPNLPSCDSEGKHRTEIENTMIIKSSVTNTQPEILDQVKRKLTFQEMSLCTKKKHSDKSVEFKNITENSQSSTSMQSQTVLTNAEKHDRSSNLKNITENLQSSDRSSPTSLQSQILLSKAEGNDCNSNFKSITENLQFSNSISPTSLHPQMLLTKAQEYDRTSNFNCLEGPSKVQNLVSDDETSSIQLSSQSCSFSSSSITLEQASLDSNLEANCYKDIQLSSKFNLSEDTMKSQLSVSNLNKAFVEEIDATVATSTNSYENPKVPKFNLTQNLTLLQATVLNNDEISLCNYEYYTLLPKFNPPSREDITRSLDEYNIPSLTYLKPFYSDCEDISGEVQIGHKRLKVETLYSGLIEFENTLTATVLQQLINEKISLLCPREQMSGKSINTKLSLCEDSDCVLTPAVLPPTRLDILSWIKAKNEKVKPVVKKVKQKVLVPCSPNEVLSDESLISISPFSPISEKTEPSETDSVKQTPVIKSKVLKKRRSRLKAKNLGKYLNASIPESKSLLKKTLLQSQLFNNIITQTQIVETSHLTGASPDNTHGFLISLENLQKARAVSEHQYLTTMMMELHTQTRLELNPNPEFDCIRAIFYSILNDVPENSVNVVGAIVVNLEGCESFKNSLLSCSGSCSIIFVDSEVNLINKFVEVFKGWDPDVIGGYEIQMLSWGYLLERAHCLSINLHVQLSRAELKFNASDDEVNSELKVTGRIVLDVWRLMRHEIALQSYTFENIVYHILHKRTPLYSFKDLSLWWEDINPVYRHRAFNFYLYRVIGILELFDRLDLIGRTSELARLFGIQFYEVLSRGSQFRVESMMLRLAKPLNFIPVSPSVQQRAKMRAPEFLPLILEPDSQFYVDPVIVLDFQSLYPSMIIAYNYCFSTCLGRVEFLGNKNLFEFGATQLKVHPKLIDKLLRKDLVVFSPCGVAFVKSKVREGILPRMLTEILDTRLMVKKSMKQNSEDKLLQRVLHSRQLGLKLIANVTYGYTAANFSGRMPSVEVGDSVVSKGRETLMRAIKLIENTPRWGAKVVYGDTDSIFVLVPGKSREHAFQIGEEIAEQVTNDNPSPVKLKLEKIFHPCILQTKKRYVGYMYESVNQTEPEFCAKGIETVRRDGCPAVSKMLEKTLKILFETRDVSLLRKYVIRQFSKLLTGRVSLQDLIFAKEYRGAANYRPGACVPVLELTRKWLAVDKRSEPRHGERVPYIIVNGPPGLPLIKLVRSPRDLLVDTNLRPNILYYITRVIIPPLNRCFTLIGVDLNKWFNSMPRKQIRIARVSPDSKGKRTAISHYFISTDCVICNQQAQDGVCGECRKLPQDALVTFNTKVRLWNRSHQEASLVKIFNCIKIFSIIPLIIKY